MEARLLSRAEKLMNPFIAALEAMPGYEGIVHRANSEERIDVPAIVIGVSGGEERLDHGGDSWDFIVTITAARGPGEYHLLDVDAAAIETATTTRMAGDPNISLMIAEEGNEMDWPIDGKVRQFQLSVPIFVVFS